MPVFVTSVSGGNCISLAPNGLLNKKASKGDKSQSWIIEHDGDSSKIALKCVANNQYLHADSGSSYASCKTGAKQLWQMEPGIAPASFWLKCTSYPNAYLCNANGSHAENNKIYCWPKQANWTHALTWYLQDVSSADPLGRLEDYSQGSGNSEKLKEREQALMEREAELKAFEESLTKTDTELHTRQQALKEREDKAKERDKETGPVRGGDAAVAERKIKEENRRLAAELAEAQEALSNDRVENGSGRRVADDSLVRENKRLAAELASLKSKFAKAGKSQDKHHVLPPLRKLPPIIRPAQHLPKGFDKALAKPVGSL